ncbi:hypothetical protein P7K49_002304 [Saguinus oedipus]|uniref:Guanylate kinase/L-type calcium channel beta subunit domain-containing protein n=1 Tax=Saguinus oedipus TaxID=9490 RepID=A0ABQ9WH06_SAGOE|nr:hypothetical protein P7K49_002304 [Saguinus oedipus]
MDDVVENGAESETGQITQVLHTQPGFLELGEYKENVYGTSLEAIQAVMAKHKVCLVGVEPEEEV